MKEEVEDFEAFIKWLKKDGLKPKRSERLWRKKIFANLQNGHPKSLANYEDFLVSKKLKSLIGEKVNGSSIFQAKIIDDHCVVILFNASKLIIHVDELDEFIKKLKEK
jgi:hypothetical protein